MANLNFPDRARALDGTTAPLRQKLETMLDAKHVRSNPACNVPDRNIAAAVVGALIHNDGFDLRVVCRRETYRRIEHLRRAFRLGIEPQDDAAAEFGRLGHMRHHETSPSARRAMASVTSEALICDADRLSAIAPASRKRCSSATRASETRPPPRRTASL